MTSRKTMLVAQILITFMMALSMSGLMSLLALGPTAQWLASWPRQFIMGWPIAFVLTLFVGPFAFKLAGRLTGKPAA